MPRFGDLSNLSAEKLQELETVLKSVLALPIARDTYAQIIDGTPTRTPYFDDIKARRSRLKETIILSDSLNPTDQAMQLYEEIRTTFAPQGLKIDLKARTSSLIIVHLIKPDSTQLAQNYQNALPGSREHRLRLLEIAAASVNAWAGMIYTSFHPDTTIMPARPPEGHYWQFRRTDRFYVNFYHTRYKGFEHYPFGLLNVVGYWAEAQLFGGVILFERVESDHEVQSMLHRSGKIHTHGYQIINAFLHPQKTPDAFQLSEKQLKSFADLGITEGVANIPCADTVLPFAKETNARTELTFVRVGEAPLRIYKNEYDKQPISYLEEVPSCVIPADDERMKMAWKIVEENGWDKEPLAYPPLPGLLQANVFPGNADPSRDGASSSSPKEGPPSANRKGP